MKDEGKSCQVIWGRGCTQGFGDWGGDGFLGGGRGGLWGACIAGPLDAGSAGNLSDRSPISPSACFGDGGDFFCFWDSCWTDRVAIFVRNPNLFWIALFAGDYRCEMVGGGDSAGRGGVLGGVGDVGIRRAPQGRLMRFPNWIGETTTSTTVHNDGRDLITGHRKGSDLFRELPS